MLEGILILTVVNIILLLFNIYLRKRDLSTLHNFKGIINELKLLIELSMLKRVIKRSLINKRVGRKKWVR